MPDKARSRKVASLFVFVMKIIKWSANSVRGWKDVPDITRLYRNFNRKFFEGKLPKARIYWALFEDIRIDGQFEKIMGGNRDVSEIRIGWHLIHHSTEEVKRVLLHEMVHVEGAVSAVRLHRRESDPHGQEFWNRVAKLAKDGALKEIL